MRIILTIALILSLHLAYSQTDSTEIKLTHYKELFIKGFISAQEYETLKQHTLGLSTEQPKLVVAAPVITDSMRIADSLLIRKMILQGRVDAKAYYGPGGPAAATAFTSVFFGAVPIGLIPAIICSQTKPKEENLNYPDPVLFKNPDYANSYRMEARRIKTTHTWIGWGGGVAANILVGVVAGVIVGNKKK